MTLRTFALAWLAAVVSASFALLMLGAGRVISLLGEEITLPPALDRVFFPVFFP